MSREDLPVKHGQEKQEKDTIGCTKETRREESGHAGHVGSDEQRAGRTGPNTRRKKGCGWLSKAPAHSDKVLLYVNDTLIDPLE